MHQLGDARLRLDRAREHMKELTATTFAFISAEHEIARGNLKLNPEPGVLFMFGRSDNPVPSRVGILVGDVVQDLRTTLDYLVYQLAKRGSQGVVQQGTQFPIEDRTDAFRMRHDQTARRGVYLRGVQPRHTAAIQVLQPCYGCKWTATLRDLSNEDKHRKLGLCVQNTGISMGASVDPAEAADVFIDGSKITTVAKPGNDTPYSAKMEFYITLFVAFDDGAPVIETLQILESEVGNVLTDFEPEFE